MNKLAKFLIIVVGGIAVFSIALVLILFTVINPNRYRGTLENLVAQQTGLQLSIAGDMAWQFWPVFGIGIEDVRLRNPDSPQELASFSRISLRLEPIGLLRGQLNMEEVVADNLH
ncbi:MAG TPA: AsmA family protein, partial [Pseudohongiella sp.]|nr:AsmA family protein [Pseudohongiella sp.]